MVAQGTPPATQASQINTMVENLANRMQENPEDAKGLAGTSARSYEVLERYDEALAAMAQSPCIK
jgi:cytochrome c-type biogenesis protein CcmH/NrfG